jgi:modulator of FtsH protease HflC
MLHNHSHGPGDDDDDDHHHHHHHHHHDGESGGTSWPRMAGRGVLACVVLAAGILAACAMTVEAGTAEVVTRFGDPIRVLMKPGLAWKLPVPVDSAIPVDLRLRTSDTGLQDVGTRDGLRVLVQASIAWQVAPDPEHVRQFLRSVRNDPDEAARQLRSFVGSALQVTASSFDLDQLVDTDAGKLRLEDFEQRLREQVADSVLRTYGIAVRQVGIQRLSLPEPTLVATVNRMRSERETVAAERTAQGLRAAAEIRSEAARDARITVAKARTSAADIEADSRKQAAQIYGKAYESDPQLYLQLRSLDTLGTMVGPNTRIVLRTDAAPFDALTQGPTTLGPSGTTPPSAAAPPPAKTP